MQLFRFSQLVKKTKQKTMKYSILVLYIKYIRVYEMNEKE